MPRQAAPASQTRIPQSGMPQQMPSVPGRALTRMLSPDQVARRDEAQQMANQPTASARLAERPERARDRQTRPLPHVRDAELPQHDGHRPKVDRCAPHLQRSVRPRTPTAKSRHSADLMSLPESCRESAEARLLCFAISTSGPNDPGIFRLLQSLKFQRISSRRSKGSSPRRSPSAASSSRCCKSQTQFAQQQQAGQDGDGAASSRPEHADWPQPAARRGPASPQTAQAGQGTQQGPQLQANAEHAQQALQMAVQGAQMPQPPQMPPPPPVAQGPPTPPPGQPWMAPLARRRRRPACPARCRQMPTPDQIEERVNQLREAARKAAKKNAVKEAKAAARGARRAPDNRQFLRRARRIPDRPADFPVRRHQGPDRADVLPGQMGQRHAGAQAGPEDVLEPRLPLRPLLDAYGAQRT